VTSQAALNLYLDPKTQVPLRDSGPTIFDALIAQPVWSPDIVREAKARAERRAMVADTLLDMTVQFDPIKEDILRVGEVPTQAMPIIIEVESDVHVPVVRTHEELQEVLKGKVVPRHKVSRKIRFKRTKAVLKVLATIEMPTIKTPSVKPALVQIVRWGYDQGLWNWGK
jgi:hypothetical protein